MARRTTKNWASINWLSDCRVDTARLKSSIKFGGDGKVKQVYKITYPTGKIYIGKDSVGSFRYFGSPDIDVVNQDFEKLPDAVKKDYTVRKQILWESASCSEAELARKEVELIRQHESNNPEVGYNRWPKWA